MRTLRQALKHWWHAGTDTIDMIDSSTETVFATIAVSVAGDIDRAVDI